MNHLIDDVMPTWDHVERHTTRIDAPASVVWRTLHTLQVRDLPVSVFLSTLRTLFARPGQNMGSQLDKRVIEAFPVRPLLWDEPRELVLGDVANYVGRQITRAPIPTGNLEHFVGLSEPGWSKSAMNFRIVEEEDHVVVHSETRVVSTDPRTRKTFRRYWSVIRLGSAAIRLELLHAVKKAAEDGARHHAVQDLSPLGTAKS